MKIIVVERDNGGIETYVENNSGKPKVKEAVSQREKYLKKGYKIDEIRRNEVVVNLACEKTREKKKKDLFPLGGIVFHTGSDGYEMGNVVRQKGTPLSSQVLQKAANACEDVVLGINRLLVHVGVTLPVHSKVMHHLHS